MEKIVFCEIEKWEEDYIRKALPDHVLELTPEKLEATNASKFEDATILSPFIYSTVNAETLSKMPHLKYISSRSMGFDHIDLSYCASHNIAVSNVPTYGSHTVAEHAFALILALSKKLITSVEQAKKGDFSSVGLTGFDLFGKTLGVIGTGHIGKSAIQIAQGFGMKVLAHNRTIDEDLVLKGVSFVSLDELLANSDVVSLHLPACKETNHIINMENIGKFKKGAILINTARGSLVETQAVLEGLEKGILSGAGLDVLEEEVGLKEEREFLSSEYLSKVDLKTQLLDHVLLTRDDVVITPHNAFNSNEALIQILDTTILNIKAFLMGKYQNLVKTA